MPSPRIPGQIPPGARPGIAPTGATRSGISPAPSARDLPTVPAHALPHRSSTELLALARHGLAEAAETRPDGQRYATAHLAALRAAAAVLVARARPTPTRRGRPTNVWALLALVAPEMAQWADRFAAGAAKRSAAEAGIMHVVSATEADTLCRDAQLFLTAVELTLGHPAQLVAAPA
jgi:HEPN superfamily protein